MFDTRMGMRQRCAAVVAVVTALTLLSLRPGLADGIKLDSREYKLMLKPGNFAGTDPRAAIDRFVREELAPRVRAEWTADAAERLQDKGLKLEKSRIVRFKDTADCLLSRSGFAWRERFKLNGAGERSSEATGTLKFRSPDAFLAAASRKSGGGDCKFEEDLAPLAIRPPKANRTALDEGVTASPRSIRSQFSQSCSHEIAAASLPLDLATAARLNPSFEPGLRATFSEADLSLRFIVGDDFLERVYERGKLKLAGDTEVEFALTVWYPAVGDQGQPFIAEISYNYETRDHNVTHEVARRALGLLLKLQESTWADPPAPTKTAYAKCESSN